MVKENYALNKVYEYQNQISQLRKKIKDLEDEKDLELTYILFNNITENEGYKLKKVTRTKRKIIPSKFESRHPELFNEVISIKVEDAKRLLTKKYKSKNVDALISEMSEEEKDDYYIVEKKEWNHEDDEMQPGL